MQKIGKFLFLCMKSLTLIFILISLSMPITAQIRLTIDEGLSELLLRGDSLRFPGRNTIDQDCAIIMECNEDSTITLWGEQTILLTCKDYHNYLIYKYIRMDSLGVLIFHCTRSYEDNRRILSRVILIDLKACAIILDDFWTSAIIMPLEPNILIGEMPYYLYLSSFEFLLGKKDIQILNQQFIPVREAKKCIFIYEYTSRKAWYSNR